MSGIQGEQGTYIERQGDDENSDIGDLGDVGDAHTVTGADAAALASGNAASAAADTKSNAGAASELTFDVDLMPGGLQSCLEAVLMVADQPQHAGDLARVLGVEPGRVRQALTALQSCYEGDELGTQPHGFELRHTARGWQLGSRAVYEPVVSAFVTDGQTSRLSQAALEALAIIAYQQPVTRARVAAIRGVNSDGVVRSLVTRGLVMESGVDPDSRAALLVTSSLFLEKMGLESLDQLPELAPFMPDQGDVTEGQNL